MKLILAGCEYAGKRTLGHKIWELWSKKPGYEKKVRPPPATTFHDHFTFPHVIHAEGHEDHRDQSEKDIQNANPGLVETFQRYQMEYHFQPGFFKGQDFWLIDWYYGEAVYAPFKWGYGRPGEYGDRRESRKHWDERLMELYPGFVLVLMEASPEAIQQRMRDGNSLYPKRHQAAMLKGKDVGLKTEDIGHVLQRFREEYEGSLIQNRFKLDTSTATVRETLDQFVEKIKPYLDANELPPCR